MPETHFVRVSVPVNVCITVARLSKNEPDENAIKRACQRIELELSSDAMAEILREHFKNEENVGLFPLEAKIAETEASVEDTWTKRGHHA